MNLTDEHRAELARHAQLVTHAFPVLSPEQAAAPLLLSLAAVGHLELAGREPVNIEWFHASLTDLLDQAREALGDAYDLLTSVIDDTGNPDTMNPAAFTENAPRRAI